MHKVNEKATISVIVPVYRIDYTLLRTCLDTLEAQDYDQVEFILVDDGSPDKCGVICDEYAKRDERFLVLHEKNAGVSAARNTGMNKANGDYYLFVDADDGIFPGFLTALAERLERDDADVVFFDFVSLGKDGYDFSETEQPDEGTVNLPSDFAIAKGIVEHTDSLLGFPSIMFGSPWGKAFKASFIEEFGCRFPLGIKKTQDRIFMVDVLSHNPATSHFPCYGYVYVEQAGSVCRRYNPEILDILGEAEQTFVRVIKGNYSGQQLEEMMDATVYLRINYFFSSLPISFFHREGNPEFGRQKSEFVSLCRKYSDVFYACRISKMPIRRKRILLVMFKLALYGCVYELLKWHYGRS